MYLYYALFNIEDDGINISFPDLEGACTSGDDMHEALFMAKDLLAGWLINAQDDNEDIPVPSTINEIVATNGELIVPIEVNLEFEKARFSNELVKKTLTIPKYLNYLGVEAGINFSQLLTESLKKTLEVN